MDLKTCYLINWMKASVMKVAFEASQQVYMDELFVNPVSKIKTS